MRLHTCYPEKVKCVMQDGSCCSERNNLAKRMGLWVCVCLFIFDVPKLMNSFFFLICPVL